ncbi:MAG: MerR family transcriptional regulator [Pyrinomonadaceae bacterium]
MSESKYYGVQELVEAAARVLSSGIVPQGKGTVSEVPDERTVRYYIAQELIPEAEKQGRLKVFTDLHLFTLLAIKKFQSDGLPISIIKTLVENRTEAELKKLLGEELVVFTDETSLRNYIQDNEGAEKEEVVVIKNPAARAEFLDEKNKNDAQQYLENLLGSRRKPQAPQSPIAFSRPSQLSSPAGRPPQVNDWKRFEIAPGLELHVERGYRAAVDEQERLSIIDSITRILRSIERR